MVGLNSEHIGWQDNVPADAVPSVQIQASAVGVGFWAAYGVAAGGIVAVKSPAMGMMFFNWAMRNYSSALSITETVAATAAGYDGPGALPHPPAPRSGWLKYHEGVDLGHTLDRHVVSEAFCQARVASGAAAASRWWSQDIAEQTISTAISKSRTQVSSWLRSGNSRDLEIIYGDVSGSFGQIFTATGVNSTVNEATVVLRRDGRGGFFILTAYPGRRNP